MKSVWILLVYILKESVGSSGDIQPEYRNCISSCSGVEENQPGFGLRLLGWDITSNCQYICQIEDVSKRMLYGRPIVQYYGKWPFIRVLGVQEFFSTVFSMGNAAPHIYYLLYRRHQYAPSNYMLSPVLIGSSINGINTWWWSTVFHARDTWWTERLDYHGATLLLVAYAWIAVLRLYISVFKVNYYHASMAALIVFGVSFCHHVYLMNTSVFDYGYNMKYNAFIFVVQLSTWFMYAYHRRHCKHVLKVIKFQMMLSLAATFEIFDFPPFFLLIDAHAVWHLLTIFLGFYWYSFLEDDAASIVVESKRIV